MKISIIGAGNVGAAMARLLVSRGHHVTLSASSRTSARLAEAASASGAAVADVVEAAQIGEVIVIAIPFSAVDAALRAEVSDALVGKVVIDATNPLATDYMSLTIGHTTSAGEEVARRLPGAFVVKAFNTVFADALATPQLGGVTQIVPLAGDDEAAKATVAGLVAELGFDVVDTGPLTNARYLEPAVELLIQLGFAKGLGTQIGLALARA